MAGEEKPSVYVESTIISYLMNRLSESYLVSAHQRVTKRWWEEEKDKDKDKFHLLISDSVIKEIQAGDHNEGVKRLEVVKDIEVLEASEEVRHFARLILEKGIFPPKKAEDAFHFSFSAVNGIDYLLTWNCTHIANAQIMKRVIRLCEAQGYEAPVICTPLEFMGE